jgi:hypothetical protein
MGIPGYDDTLDELGNEDPMPGQLAFDELDAETATGCASPATSGDCDGDCAAGRHNAARRAALGAW